MLHDMFNDGMDDGDHVNGNGHGGDARKVSKNTVLLKRHDILQLLKPADHRNRFGFVGLENQYEKN